MVFSTHTISRGRAANKKGKKWKNSMTSNTEPQLGFSPALINKGKKNHHLGNVLLFIFFYFHQDLSAGH